MLHHNRSPPPQRRPPYLALASLLMLASCSGSGGAATDAQVSLNDHLTILTPPGDAIGLDFSASIPLRVRLTDADNQAILGRSIQFSLVAVGEESVGGTTLSSADSQTNAEGLAQVDLVAGAERVVFRVEARASNAPSVLFYIQVSDQGFSDLRIISTHQGPRAENRYNNIELRIYDDRDVRCPSIDFLSPPDSQMAPRSQRVFGETSLFQNLSVGVGYTIIAWAEAGAEASPQATGCLHLPRDRLRSGTILSALLPIEDTAYRVAEPLHLQTRIALQSLAENLPGAGAWRTLACPLGRAQLLLDCLEDAQTPDDALDCSAHAQGPLQSTMNLRRGAVDESGCRPASLASGQDSLDAQLGAALAGWPTAAQRTALTHGRDMSLGTILIDSILYQTGATLARHRIVSASLAGTFVDLTATTRPILDVNAISLALDASPTLSLADHAFTLHFDQIAAPTFETLGLLPAQISGRGQSLGSAIIEGVDLGGGNSACMALEGFVCTTLGLQADCANRCSSIAAPLSVELGAWLTELAATDLDYHFAMQATIDDSDDSLAVNSLSAQEDSVQVRLDTANPSQSFALPATVGVAVP